MSSNSQSKYKPPLGSFFPSQNLKPLLTKPHLNQVCSKTSNALNPSKFSILSEPHTKNRTSSKKSRNDSLEDFFHLNGFDEYITIFHENQISFKNLPFLTKDDLAHMRIPIGPRNRLLKIIENLEKNNAKSHFYPSNKRASLRDEVDEFMLELSQFSKRPEKRLITDSLELGLDASFEREGSQKIRENILVVLKDISDKQEFMLRAVEENRKAIMDLGELYSKF